MRVRLQLSGRTDIPRLGNVFAAHEVSILNYLESSSCMCRTYNRMVWVLRCQVRFEVHLIAEGLVSLQNGSMAINTIPLRSGKESTFH